MYCGVIGSRNSQPTGNAETQDLEQEAACEPQAGVDVAGAVQMRVVDQALPADRGARLLEVDAHHDQQVVAQALGLGAEALGVLTGRVKVVDAAGTDDDHQPVIVAVEHGVGSGAAVQQHLDAIIVQRELVEQLLRCDQRYEALDPLIADRIDLGGADHGHRAWLFLWRFIVSNPLECSIDCTETAARGLRRVAWRGTAGARLRFRRPRLDRTKRGV